MTTNEPNSAPPPRSTARIDHVLVVDDDVAVGRVLRAQLLQAGYHASLAHSAREALAILETQLTDLVLTDLRMPELDGLALLALLKERWPEVAVVMLTAHGTVPSAVAAMRAGASDFLLKPFEREDVLATLQRVLSASAGRRAAPPSMPSPGLRIVGSSAASAELRERVGRAAQGLASVLIEGEAGSGKQLAAQLIKQGGPRADKPLITVELATTPAELLEGELFGHSPVSASEARPSRIELARGGSLLLKDVDTLPLPVQTRLMALLSTPSSDVRLLASSRNDLAQLCKQGLFRDDLYYQLSVVPIRTVPLRARSEDVRPLALHFLASFAAAHQLPVPSLAERAWHALLEHDWPGNVRELASLMERLLVLHAGEQLEPALVERELRQRGAAEGAAAAREVSAPFELSGRVHATERATIVNALAKAGGNRTLAARLLGVSRRTLYNKLAEHGIP